MSIAATSTSDYDAVVVYNDGTTQSQISYTSSTRTICPGASLLGFSTIDETGSTGDWVHTRKSPGAGMGAFWGDSAITRMPGTGDLNTVFITQLLVPSSKMPGCVVDDFYSHGASLRDALGGAVIFKSTNRGRTFGYYQTVSHVGVGGVPNRFDGSSLAAGPGSNGAIFAAYWDTNSSRIRVYRATSKTASFTALSTPMLSSTHHPRIAVDEDGRLYVMYENGNTLWLTRTLTSAASGTPTWDASLVVASGIQTAHDWLYPGMVAGQIGTLRPGVLFSFDIGRNENNTPELRYMYNKTVSDRRRIFGGKCAILSTQWVCNDVAAWTGHTTPNAAGDQIRPLVKYGGFKWAFSYYSRQHDPNGNSLTLWAGELVGGPAPSNPRSQIVGTPLLVCSTQDGY
jgi:hypothetical protein